MRLAKHTRLALLASAAAFAHTATADTILIGTELSSILAYDTDTGSVTFRGLCAGPVDSMSVLDGTLYLGDDFGSVYSFDLDTNQLTGAFPVSGDAVAMSTDGEWLYLADSSGEIQKIDPATGAVEATRSDMFNQVTSVGVHWGNIYYGGLNTVAERAPLSGAFEDEDFQLFAVCGGPINSMTFVGLDVVLGATNGSIYRYDEFNGLYRSVHHVGVDAVAIAPMTGGRLLVADSDGTLLEVDYTTGAILRETNVGEGIGAMVALDVGDACRVDMDLSGVLDLADIQTFVMLMLDNRLGADLDGNSVLDLSDVGVFVSEFTGGCP